MFAGLLSLMLAPQVSIEPVPRPDQWWKERHERCVATTKAGGFDVAFLGDSITQGWEGDAKPVWDSAFGPYKPANFGFSGDRTEHVLWRLANGEIVGAKPKLVVIMIGTNNLGHGSSNSETTAIGVQKIVSVLKEKTTAKILLLAIFPRGREANDPLRVAVADASSRFKSVADGKRVVYQDIGAMYIRRDGTLRDTLMPDLLHLSKGGYELWAKAVQPTITWMLKE